MTTDANEPPTESEIFHVLGNDRRRAILDEMVSSSGSLDVATVARSIAERETTSDDDAPTNLYKSVYVSLQQTHLPQLESDGIITYEATDNTIEHGPHFERIEGYLTQERSFEYSPLRVTFLVALGGLAATVLSEIGIPVIASIGSVIWATGALFLVSLLSLFAMFR